MDDRSIEIRLTFGANIVDIKRGSQFRLLSISGIESADYDVSLEEYAQIDGGYVANEKHTARQISITFAIAPLLTTQEALRQQLIDYASASSDITLTVTRNGRTRSIACRIDGRMSFEQANVYRDRVHATLPLVCPDPWFVGSEIENDFRSVKALFTMPLIFYPSAGVSAGVLDASASQTIVNAGDKETGFVITMTAQNAVTNPKVMNAAGKYVKVLTTLAAGETIEISTVPKSKYVKKNGVYCMLYDRGSTFFQLAQGSNALTVSADSGSTSQVLKYSQRYRGV